MTDRVKSRTSIVTRMRLAGLWGANLFAIVWFALFVLVSFVVAFTSDNEYAVDRVSAIAAASLPIAALLLLWMRSQLANWGFCPDCRALCRRRLMWFDPSDAAYRAVSAAADGRITTDLAAAIEDMRAGSWATGRRSLYEMPCDVCGMEWLQVRTLVGDMPKTVVNKPVRRVPAGAVATLESVVDAAYARLRAEQEQIRQAKVMTPEKVAAMKDAVANRRKEVPTNNG